MTPEEQRRIAAERKRAYRQRKRSEELARQAPKEEQGYHDIVHEALVEAVESATPNFRKPPESVSYDDHREKAQAVTSEAEERYRRVELIMANYKKEAANGNALLWHILETLTLMRLELTDLIGGLKCGTK